MNSEGPLWQDRLLPKFKTEKEITTEKHRDDHEKRVYNITAFVQQYEINTNYHNFLDEETKSSDHKINQGTRAECT